MSMDIEKTFKGTSEQKVQMGASVVGGIIGGFVGGYPGMQIGMAIGGYIFKPDEPSAKDYFNDDHKLYRSKLDPVPDVIGTDLSSGKIIYLNKNTLGVYNSAQLPDLDPFTSHIIEWQGFIDSMASAKVAQWAEFAVCFSNEYYGGANHHMGVPFLNGKPFWLWVSLSDMFENYDNSLDPYQSISMLDASNGSWTHSNLNVDTEINLNVADKTILYFKGFLADFTALSTAPETSNITIDVTMMAGMNPGTYQIGSLGAFPTFLCEINRAQAQMSPESMSGGSGMPVSTLINWGTPGGYSTSMSTYWNNRMGYNRYYCGLNNDVGSVKYPVYIERMEGLIRYPANDGGTTDPTARAWFSANLVKDGSRLSAIDIHDDRVYVLSFRNWYNPNQGRGVFGIDKVNHHHAELGIQFDLYYHDTTDPEQYVHSVLYNYTYSIPNGSFNGRITLYSMQVDDTYAYLFGSKVQTDVFVSDQREITSGANSYTRCYADFSQYEPATWGGYYAALQQEGFLKWCLIISQTDTYIDVEDEQNGITGGWSSVPLEGEVVEVRKYPKSDCAYAIAGEGSTDTIIICSVPPVTDMCSPYANFWERAGLTLSGADQIIIDNIDGTKVTLTSAMSSAPNPGEFIYFTQPDEEYDEDIVNPEMTEYDLFLIDIGISAPQRATVFDQEFQKGSQIVLRVNKDTGVIDLWKEDSTLRPWQYGQPWFTSPGTNFITCATEKQIFVYANDFLHGSSFCTRIYLIDNATKEVQDEHYHTNQDAPSHSAMLCYMGTVSIKEWSVTAGEYIDMWYSLVRVFESGGISGLNSATAQGTHLVKLTEGKFEVHRVVGSNAPLLRYGFSLKGAGVQTVMMRKGVATGPLYTDMYINNTTSENDFQIGKFTLTEEIYFYVRRWQGLHGAAGHNESWKYIPPNEQNPAGELYMLNKWTTYLDDEKYSFSEIGAKGNFQQSVYGFYGNGTGRWYQCDESPPNIINLFWRYYIDPRYLPNIGISPIYINEALAVANGLVPATIYRPQGNIDLQERRFQFSKTFDQPKKMHDVINEILVTCQGFIVLCNQRDTGPNAPSQSAGTHFYRMAIPNPNEVPQLYFGLDEAIFTSDQLSDEYQRIYADFSAYPDNYWKGDFIDFGQGMDFKWPTAWDRNWAVIIEQTSTYIQMGSGLQSYFPSSQQFTLKKDNIKEGSFKFAEKSEMDRPNKVRIEFKNRLSGYIKDVAEAEDTYRLDILGETEKIDFYKMHGIKRATQAGRMALRILDQWNYQKHTCGFETDVLGMTLCMGDIIGVSHITTGWNAKWFRIVSMDEMIDFEVQLNLEEFNPHCYHDSGVPVVNTLGYGGFPQPYIPNNVERFEVKEDIETGRLHFVFKPPANDGGFFVGARIYRQVGSTWEYLAVINEAIPSVRLDQDVGINDTTIYYDPDTIYSSFPSQGVIWVGDELMYYHGIDSTNNAFTNVVRGYKDSNQVAHLIEDELYITLRDDSTLYYEVTDSSWVGTSQVFRASAFTIHNLTADLDASPSASIDIVGYGLLPFFPESIQNKLPEFEFLFESLGMGDDGYAIVIEFITETLGLGDDGTVSEFLVAISESIGMGDGIVVEMTEYLTETLGLGDDFIEEATEYLTETLGLGDTDTIAEMLVAISESLGLGDGLAEASDGEDAAMMILQNNLL